MSDLSVMAARLTEGGRGLLAVDQAPAQLDEVLRRGRVAATEANRRGLCALVLAAPGLDRVAAGVLVDAAVLADRAPLPLLVHGLVPVGVGAALRRPPTGADFARRQWVSAPGSTLFEREQCARQVAEWASDCQRDGVVPLAGCVVRVGERDPLTMVSARHADAVSLVLTALDRAGVDRAGCLLGLGMPLPGRRAREVATSEDVARASCACLRAVGADGIGGVVFSSEGLTRQLAGHLVAMRWLSPHWPIGFRLGSDLLIDVARAWRGRPQLVAAGQRELLRQLTTMSSTMRAAAS